MNFIKSPIFCATLFTTTVMGMDQPPEPHKTERLFVDSIFEVKPKGEGKPCYLMGTQHVNGDVSDAVVNFVTTNLSQVYFEEYYNDEFEQIAARFFANAYLEAQQNLETGKAFVLPYNLDQNFKFSINTIEKQFKYIGYYMPSEQASEEGIKSFLDYCGQSINKKREREKSKKNEIKFINKLITDGTISEGLKEFVGATQELSRIQTKKEELYNKLCDDDQLITNQISNIFDNTQAQIEIYVPETLIKSIQEKPSFFNTTLPHLNPIDIISLALYKSGFKLLDKVSSAMENNGHGVEVNLQNKIEILNPTISFDELETDYTLLMGIRNMVAKHTSMDNPYEQWSDVLGLVDIDNLSKQDQNAITGEPRTKGEILPQFLIDALNGSFYSEREIHWLKTIRASMTPSSEGNGTLFAVGGLHIPHLCDYLTKEGYTITKMDLSDTSSEHHNS